MLVTPEIALALELLAISEDGLTAAHLGSLMSDLGPRKVRFTKASIESLLSGPISLGEVSHSTRFSLAPGIGEPMVRKSIREGRYSRLSSAITKLDPLDMRYGGHYGREGVLKREVRRALVDSDWPRYVELYRLRSIPIVPLVTDPLEPEIIRKLTGNFAAHTLDKLSGWWLDRATPAPGLAELCFERAEALVEHPFGALAAIRCAVLTGEIGRLPEMLEKSDIPSMSGLAALVSGKIKPAASAFAKQISTQRSVHHRRDIVLDGLEGALIPLVFLLEGSAGKVKAALATIDLISEETAQNPSGLHIGWLHLARWAEPSRPAPKSGEHPLAVLMEALTRAWSDAQVDLERVEAAAVRADACGWRWVASELRAVLGRPPMPGTVALVSHRHATPRWETQLQAIETALGGEGPRQNRIAWYVSLSPLQIEAREQIRQKGGWSAGKRVTHQRLQGQGQGKKLELTDDDLRVTRCMRTQRTWYGTEVEWAVPDVLLALHSHPHVFTTAGEPLTIALLRPRLSVTRSSDGSVTLRAEKPPDNLVRIEAVGDRGVEVTAFDKRHVDVMLKLTEPLQLPASESERADALVERLSELFEVAGEAGREAAREADPSPVVQLWPESQQIAARIVVRPLGPDGPALTPGSGSPALLAAVQGEPCRAERDLVTEDRNVRRLLATVPELEPESAGSAVLLPDLYAVLSLLDALKRCEPPVSIEWPSGAEIRLRSSVSSRSMSVSVRRKGDWFAATGELTIDDDLSLPLHEILDRLGADTGRFVRLDDGSYVALTEKLAKKLDAMSRISRSTDGKGDDAKAVEVHPLAIDLLEDLLEEAGQGKTDAAFRKQIAARKESLPDPPLPAGLQAELRPYQLDGFRWLVRLAHLGAGAALADDMGLGKTVMALALLLHRAAEGPALVVAPTSVTSVWRTEAWRFAPDLRLIEISDGGRAAALPDPAPGDVVVCSYGLLVNAIDRLSSVRWATVIADEAQAVKNPDTQRHKALLRVGGAFRIALTGTPVENHIGDLWSLFAFLNPGLLGSQSSFAKRFATPLEEGDRAVQQQLHRLVAPFILRRIKASVLSDLPPRTVIDWMVDLGPAQAGLYEAARREAQESTAREGDDAMKLLAHLTRLRLAACHPRLVSEIGADEGAKLLAFDEILESLTASRHRALVFSQFVRHLSLLRERLDERGIPYQYLDGETPSKERALRVEAFQRGEGVLFLISLRAGGFGLNLTAADYVIHLDPWWNPAVEDQATDRAHRIGQTRPVTVYRLIARGTIEEKILELHRTKRDLADRLLAGTDTVARLTREEMLALLSS